VLIYTYAKEPYKRDYIPQKRPIILRSLLIDATPYTYIFSQEFKKGLQRLASSDPKTYAKEPYKRDCILQKRPII